MGIDILSEEDLLEVVDEYSIYCKYLNFEPLIGGTYPSPFRADENPSFGIFVRKYGHGPHEYLWKDQGFGKHGDVFDLVSHLYGIDRLHALLKVEHDFDLGGLDSGTLKIKLAEPKFATPTYIRIRSRKFERKDVQYWLKYNVTVELLNRYHVSALQAYWMTAAQEIPCYPPGYGYAYRIWDKYQLYFPFVPREKKFKNNWTNICVPGYLQLTRTSDLCIITKAFKDVLCLASFGYEAVAPRGESILLPEECIANLKRSYKRVLVLFDNDGKHAGDKYPFPLIQVPVASGTKDISDYCAKYGADATRNLLKVLTNESIETTSAGACYFRESAGT